MKTLDILFNTSLKQVQGINYVNNSFVQGKKYFGDNGILLNNIYSPDGIFKCSEHEYLDTIGSDIGTYAYKRNRRIRSVLKQLFSSKYLLGCIVKLFFNTILPAKRVVSSYFENSPNSDYIIFQDTFTAYFYYKSKKRNNTIKSILILHCGKDPIEQAIPMFPGLFKYKNCEQMFRATVEYAMRSCDKVVYLSESATEFSLLDDMHKTFIYNGVDDIDGIQVEGVTCPLNFVIVASTIYHKGHHVLLEALSILDDNVKRQIHLYIIGSGTEFEEFKNISLAFGLGDIVTFMGNRNDVPEQLRHMDVFILPSLSEGMPMSIIEAMRQGLYIMATPVGGVPEMLQPAFSKIIDREPQSLADSISDVVINKIVTKEAKQAAREYYLEKFTLQKMINSYSEILLSL